MDLESIIKLIHTVSDSSLSSFTLEEGDMKLSLTTGGVPGDEGSVKIIREPEKTAVRADREKEAEEDRREAAPLEGQVVTSPLVGTFYASSGPKAERYVRVGDPVRKGQILGIVEAMKLMNEIESEFDGTVKEIYVENEQMVEYGQ
ncbi:MAG: acetyl-CoA carboxylase biotin carboxyl carrier protein, partial [Oscillospiraceae bacterium]|nr:acetyl-CoA carboxylase biotin carboxyl carrier protein [Oscillospiraceae bacterium]